MVWTISPFDRSVFGVWRLVAKSANRMPAAVSYLRRGDAFVAFKIDVLRIARGQVADMTTFDASLLDCFGMAATMPASRPVED